MRLVLEAVKAHPNDQPTMRRTFLERFSHTESHFLKDVCLSTCPCCFIHEEDNDSSTCDDAVFANFSVRDILATFETEGTINYLRNVHIFK